jgi:hypothetical protein
MPWASNWRKGRGHLGNFGFGLTDETKERKYKVGIEL